MATLLKPSVNIGRKMFDRSRLQPAWDRSHQEIPGSDQPEEDLVAFAERLRRQLPSARVLDAACGRGRNTLYLAQAGFSVCGCDLSPVAIQVAMLRMQKADSMAAFQVSDLAHLPFPGELFAAVVCVHALPYNPRADMAQSVREMRRVLQPNGWLYLDFLDCDDREYGCGAELEPHTFLGSDGIPIHFCSRQEVNELLQGFAFERLIRMELGSSSHPRVAWMVWATKCEG